MFEPKFTISSNLLTYIANLEAAKAIIDHSPLVPSWEAKFKDEAVAQIVHFGTKIEGNDLTQEQAQQVVRLEDELDTQRILNQTGMIARERDVQEVINYRNVISWIDKWESTINPRQVLSEDTLRKLHQLTMYNLLDQANLGHYRQQQVIVRSAVDGSIAFRPPISVEVPYLLSDFFKWLTSDQNTIHPIFKAAITHYQLVYIHPFVEGNGRTARAMATLVTYFHQYDFKRFFSIEKYFDSDVQAYYQALLSVQQQDGDLTYWLEYFCYGLALEIDKIKQKVLKISKDLKLKQQLGEQVALSERQLILLELLQQQGKISSSDAQEVLPNVSVDTILRDLKDLMAKGVVKKHGVTKGVTYQLT